jgi:hypothetical protein
MLIIYFCDPHSPLQSLFMKFLSLALTAALVLASCDSTTDPDASSVSTTMPRTGSIFAYDTYDTDTNGVKLPGSDTAIVDTVVASDIAFDDETGVWVIKGSNSDSTFYTVDKSNDVIMRGSGWDSWFNQVWIRLPIVSGVPSNVFNIDRLNSNGVLTETKRTVTTERIAEETVTVAGKSIRTFKIKVSVSRVVTQGGSVTSDYSTYHYYWFAPSIGTTIRIETPPQVIFGRKLGGAVEMLASYTLK